VVGKNYINDWRKAAAVDILNTFDDDVNMNKVRDVLAPLIDLICK
jgi:pantothenate kinase